MFIDDELHLDPERENIYLEAINYFLWALGQYSGATDFSVYRQGVNIFRERNRDGVVFPNGFTVEQINKDDEIEVYINGEKIDYCCG
ncbi:MAG: hypothetical protein R3321_00260 [Nitrososphaeraceae archaeon]|nr:hypothetical protein [Nitrososphaeraceae archaeon]